MPVIKVFELLIYFKDSYNIKFFLNIIKNDNNYD